MSILKRKKTTYHRVAWCSVCGDYTEHNVRDKIRRKMIVQREWTCVDCDNKYIVKCNPPERAIWL